MIDEEETRSEKGVDLKSNAKNTMDSTREQRGRSKENAN